MGNCFYKIKRSNMGAACAQTSCGKAYIKWKAVKEMNARGVYTPEQVKEAVEAQWNAVNPDGKSTINQDECKTVAEAAQNYLASLGAGNKWDEATYNSKKKFAGIIMNVVKKEQIEVLVTTLVTKAP